MPSIAEFLSGEPYGCGCCLYYLFMIKIVMIFYFGVFLYIPGDISADVWLFCKEDM